MRAEAQGPAVGSRQPRALFLSCVQMNESHPTSARQHHVAGPIWSDLMKEIRGAQTEVGKGH